MSESGLVEYRNLTRNYGRRTHSITKITIHHAAGVGTAKSIVDGFIPAKRKASANYCIGNDGEIGQSVLEKNRAWTSSSPWNDNRAVTIEVSNSQRGGEWPISDSAYHSLIALCVDICKRNRISSVYYDGTKNAILTEHRFYCATQCPGPYIHNLLATGRISQDINSMLTAPHIDTSYMYEGIDMSAVFNATYYSSRYPDLLNAGLTTIEQLWAHFTAFGMHEARQACASFSPVAYRRAFPDLNSAFGDDWEAYYKHYCMCGREEVASGLRQEFM